jgi:hypothetical protein
MSRVYETRPVGEDRFREVSQTLECGARTDFIEALDQTVWIPFLRLTVGSKNLNKVSNSSDPTWLRESIGDRSLAIRHCDAFSPPPDRSDARDAIPLGANDAKIQFKKRFERATNRCCSDNEGRAEELFR